MTRLGFTRGPWRLAEDLYGEEERYVVGENNVLASIRPEATTETYPL